MRSKVSVGSILFWLALLGLFGGIAFYSRPERAAYSANGVGPNGLRAMALLFESMGYSVTGWNETFLSLGESEARDTPSTLLVVSLPHVDVSGEDYYVLEQWVESGHTALLLGWAHQLEPVFRSAYAWGPRLVRARDTETLDLSGREFAQPVKSLHLEDSTRFVVDGQSRPRVLVSDPDGAVLVATRVGDGQIMLVSDTRLHVNRYIAKLENVELLVLAAREARASQIWIAEPRLAPPQPMAEPGDPSWLRHLFITIAFGLWAIGRRLGPPIPLPKDGSDLSIVDYVRGVANLYRRGRARRHVLKILYDDLLGMVMSQAGNRRGADPHAEAVRLARRRGIPEEPFRNCLERCRALLEESTPDERDLLQLANEIEAYRRSLAKMKPL